MSELGINKQTFKPSSSFVSYAVANKTWQCEVLSGDISTESSRLNET